MRSYHKGWQSHRPLNPKSRRVKWYVPYTGTDVGIRLQFKDEYGSCSRIYENVEDATYMWEAFIAGEITTRQMESAHA